MTQIRKLLDFSNKVVRFQSPYAPAKGFFLIFVVIATFVISVVVLNSSSQTVSQIGTYIDSETSQILKPVSAMAVIKTCHEGQGCYKNILTINSNFVFDFDMKNYVIDLGRYFPPTGNCGIGEGCFEINIPCNYFLIESSFKNTSGSELWICTVQTLLSSNYFSIQKDQASSSPDQCWFLQRSDVNYRDLMIFSSFSSTAPAVTSISNITNNGSGTITAGYQIYNAGGKVPSYAMIYYNANETNLIIETMNALWVSALPTTPSVNRVTIYKSWFEILSLAFSFAGFAFSVAHFMVNCLDKTPSQGPQPEEGGHREPALQTSLHKAPAFDPDTDAALSEDFSTPLVS
jgi:hypothetical protein